MYYIHVHVYGTSPMVKYIELKNISYCYTKQTKVHTLYVAFATFFVSTK